MDVEIGKNLQYEKVKLVSMTDTHIKIENASKQNHQINIADVNEIEIVGIKRSSGFCGTSEWGMSNPTFLLPTNFFYNIISLFKRNNDIVHIRLGFKTGNGIILLGTQQDYNELRNIINV